jgi:hypothetical protein
VVKYGTEQEKADVLAGKAKLRKTANKARSRRQQPPTPHGKKTPVQSNDLDADVLREVIARCADDEWRTPAKMALIVRRAEKAVALAIIQLCEAVQARGADNDEYCINSLLGRELNKRSGSRAK